MKNGEAKTQCDDDLCCRWRGWRYWRVEVMRWRILFFWTRTFFQNSSCPIVLTARRWCLLNMGHRVSMYPGIILASFVTKSMIFFVISRNEDFCLIVELIIALLYGNILYLRDPVQKSVARVWLIQPCRVGSAEKTGVLTQKHIPGDLLLPTGDSGPRQLLSEYCIGHSSFPFVFSFINNRTPSNNALKIVWIDINSKRFILVLLSNN